MNGVLNNRVLRSWGWFLIFFGIVAQVSFIFVKRESLAHAPFEEDTFFHMAVTRNMAMGKGITIDGVEPTSGAQPGNFIYVLAHLASRFDKWEALRWARLLDLLTSVGGAFCLYLIVRRMFRSAPSETASSYGIFTAGLSLSSFQVFRVNLNGYETGLAAFLLLACTAVYLRIWQTQPEGWTGFGMDAALGTLFGLSVLTRVDHGFAAASAVICFLALAKEPLRRRLVRVLTWGSAAAIVTLPWWIFNYRVGGSIMPISGKASAFQMTFHGHWPSVKLCFVRTLESVLGIFTLSFYSPYSWGENAVWILALAVGVILIVGMLIRHKPSTALGIPPTDFRPFAFLILFSLILVLYYVFFHGSWWFMKRYTHPIRAAAYIYSGFFVAACAVMMAKKLSIKPAIVFSVIATIHLLISAASVLAIYNRTESNGFRQVAVYLGENCQDGRIGAFQSGTLGYFLDNVVNLDGKNNAVALNAVVQGTIIDYMLSKRLKYIADWPEQIANYCDFAEFEKYYEPIAKVRAHTVYRLKADRVASGR